MTQNEISHQNENFIRNENWNNSFQNNLYGSEMSFRYHVNKYREIYGDGMNSFQN